jgi:Ser/Thr protein kinase RdoA (MazF antagonist)
VMRERVPDPPAPPAGAGPGLFRPGLVDVAVTFTTWAEALDHLADVPADLLPGWVLERADDVRAGLLALAAQPGRHLVHNDLRNDNLLVRPSGEVVFVDWGACGVGPAWLDPLLARAERVDRPWFDASLAGSPALAALGDEAVTTWLTGLGAYLAYRAHTATDVGLPTLREFRRRESARLLDAAARRLHLDLGGRITRR